MESNHKDDKLIELLQTKVVEFSFMKGSIGNEELRIAFGTLNSTCIPDDKQPKERMVEDVSKPTNLIKFFDLEKQDWRTCRRDNIEDIYGHMDASIWFENENNKARDLSAMELYKND